MDGYWALGMGLAMITFVLYKINETLREIHYEMKRPRMINEWREHRIKLGIYDPNNEPDWP